MPQLTTHTVSSIHFSLNTEMVMAWGAGLKRLIVGIALLAAMMISPCMATEKAAPSDPIAPDAAKASSALKPITLNSFAQLPFIEGGVLSPDGRVVAGRYAVDGRQLIGIMPLFDPSKKVMVGIPDGTQARWIRWVNDENIVVCLQMLTPVEGDRWYVSRLIGVNTRTGKLTYLLWDLMGQNSADMLWSASDGTPNILVAAQASIYLGDDFWPSVYRVNVETGRRQKVVLGRGGVQNWFADNLGNVRTGLSYNDSTRTFRLLYRGSGETGAFKEIDTANTRKREGLLSPFLFLPGTSHALVTHDDDEGRSAIYETDLATRKDVRTVFTMPEGRYEVDSPILSDDGTTLLGVSTTGANGRNHWIDPTLRDLQTLFDKAVGNKRATITSFSKDRSKMLVVVDAPDMPGGLYYYDVDFGRLQKIADIGNDIGFRQLAPVKLVHYRSRDGLDIEGILTMPAGFPDGRDLPFIVFPHGGPWGQDSLRYDYWVQFLASKGYAVLQPNFRGSTGYGTQFLRQGEGQMGLAMQDDIADGVKWAVSEGIADPKRLCIVGASYGGYAAMWGIAKDPDLYRCAISIAGVASLRREVNDFGDALMGGKFKDDWVRMTPDFNSVSPINAVSRIKAPLLLIHGKKDVTVDVSQSSRMFARMQNEGKNVQFVPLASADHYFTREQDRIALLTAMGAFLDKYNPVDVNTKQ